MYEKINYTLVGLFVLIFGALSLYFGFWLAKGDVNEKKFNVYYTYFYESVDGLTKDSVVKLNGVDVGRLKDLQIDRDNPSKIIATLYIRKDIKITKDMYAILESQGLTGLRYINIIGGKSKEIILPNRKDSIIKSKESLVAKLSKESPILVDKLRLFSERLNRLLDEKNIQNFSKILEHGALITKKTVALEDNLNSILKEFNKSAFNSFLNIAKDLNQTTISTLKEYKRLAKNGNKTLNIVNKQLPGLFASIKYSAKKLNTTTALINKTIKRGDYNLNKILQPAIVDLKDLSITYKELADELNSLLKDPTSAIFNGTKLPKGPGE